MFVGTGDQKEIRGVKMAGRGEERNFCWTSQENKQTKKIIKNKNLDCQMDIREKNSDYEMEKR